MIHAPAITGVGGIARWHIATSTYLAARAAEELYEDLVATPAFQQSQKSGVRYDDAIADRSEKLSDARCDAEEALFLTPAPGLTELLWKIRYARWRWRDMTDWPDDWWDAVFADLERFAAPKPDPHTALLDQYLATRRYVDDVANPEDTPAYDEAAAGISALERQILGTAASSPEAVIAKLFVAAKIAADGCPQEGSEAHALVHEAEHALGLTIAPTSIEEGVR